MTNDDKRSENRIRSRGCLTLLAEGLAPIQCTIYDVSPSGMGVGIETQADIGAGTAVILDGSAFAAHGIVRYCYRIRELYRVGIELTPHPAP